MTPSGSPHIRFNAGHPAPPAARQGPSAPHNGYRHAQADRTDEAHREVEHDEAAILSEPDAARPVSDRVPCGKGHIIGLSHLLPLVLAQVHSDVVPTPR
jgi:hypothetical protein